MSVVDGTETSRTLRTPGFHWRRALYRLGPRASTSSYSETHDPLLHERWFRSLSVSQLRRDGARNLRPDSIASESKRL